MARAKFPGRAQANIVCIRRMGTPARRVTSSLKCSRAHVCGLQLVANRRPTTACSRTLKGAVPISAVLSGNNLFRPSALGGALQRR